MSRPTLVACAAAFLLAAPAVAQTPPPAAGTATAIFAGGCFWCMEPPFDELEGVTATTSGYIGGDVAKPTYEQVVTGRTGHAEAVEVTYDPSVVSYERLLEVFWRNVNPLDGGGQFCDRGSQYRAALFPLTSEQEAAARASAQRVEAVLDRSIKTTIEDPTTFWPAEDYHQDYYRKNPLKYEFYRWNCGRDARLDDIWGEAPSLALTQ